MNFLDIYWKNVQNIIICEYLKHVKKLNQKNFSFVRYYSLGE